jgi:hypothetical protein
MRQGFADHKAESELAFPFIINGRMAAVLHSPAGRESAK